MGDLGDWTLSCRDLDDWNLSLPAESGQLEPSLIEFGHLKDCI